jgi:regulatory protein
MQSAIDEALDEIDDESEYRSAFDPEVQIRRIQSLLQRKGFGFSVISQVLKELDLLNASS